jgi:RNA polymerase sigma factor (sigma-70 family)
MAVTETGHAASRAIDELYRRHGREVYRYAFAVLGNHADAEDVTQTTFLNAYRALGQGVRPRKPSNWLLAIASNAIKQRFRSEQARPRHVELDESTASAEPADVEGPTVGELLAALSKIPPQQRQAIVLREFEGRSYAEIADILGVTTSALETLLFRARRSLAEELEHQLTCTEAQLAISRAADGRLGRKERRRLRDHLGECPDCARFGRAQQRHRKALKGLMLLPVPLSLHFVKGIEGTAAAATLPAASLPAAALSAATLPAAPGVVAAGAGAGAATTGGVFAGGAVLKAAAVVAAATMASGVAVSASSEDGARHGLGTAAATKPGERIGQVAPRGALVPGNGVARGKANAPGQSTRGASATAKGAQRAAAAKSAAARLAKARSRARGNPKPARAKHTPARPNRPVRTSSTAKASKSVNAGPKAARTQPKSTSSDTTSTETATRSAKPASSPASATTDGSAGQTTRGPKSR